MHPDALGVLRRHLQAAVLHRLRGGSDREMDEAPHLARFLFLDELQRIEVLHLSGKA